MEFNLFHNAPLKYNHTYRGRAVRSLRNEDDDDYDDDSFEELTRKDIIFHSHLTFNPVFNEEGDSGVNSDGSLDWTSLRDTSIDLLFGLDPGFANRLKTEPVVPITTHFTLTSSNTGSLIIESKLVDVGGVEIDIFEQLHKLEVCLPPNSIEFVLSVKDFENYYSPKETLNFFETGLKLLQNEWGSNRLEMMNIHVPDKTWREWHESDPFVGNMSLNVRVNIAAVGQLYKKISGGGPLAAEVESAADLVILVAGNKDKEKGIKCHKIILSEMSPVFAAMFQADMVEASEGTLEIVDFSEACVRALIGFAYRRDFEDAIRSSQMTLELLQAADKYQMEKLRDNLAHLVWSVPCAWFDVDVAIKLVWFAKTVGKELAKAEEKCWMVLKWYAKKYPEKLMESEEYNRLFQNPTVVKELVVRLLSKIN